MYSFCANFCSARLSTTLATFRGTHGVHVKVNMQMRLFKRKTELAYKEDSQNTKTFGQRAYSDYDLTFRLFYLEWFIVIHPRYLSYEDRDVHSHNRASFSLSFSCSNTNRQATRSTEKLHTSVARGKSKEVVLLSSWENGREGGWNFSRQVHKTVVAREWQLRSAASVLSGRSLWSLAISYHSPSYVKYFSQCSIFSMNNLVHF